MSTQVLSEMEVTTGLYSDTPEKVPTILLVEDEAFVREVTAEVLRMAGYRVLAVGNAAEAVITYSAYLDDVDLLLTDVVLPGESGSALAERLRRENPQLRVLLVTGYGAQMGKMGAKQEEWLAKPFSSEALLKTVRRVLDLKTVVIPKSDEFRRVCGTA
jgi:two-component system, cell cycle sensor histidine kinase and response regulator CckA